MAEATSKISNIKNFRSTGTHVLDLGAHLVFYCSIVISIVRNIWYLRHDLTFSYQCLRKHMEVIFIKNPYFVYYNFCSPNKPNTEQEKPVIVLMSGYYTQFRSTGTRKGKGFMDCNFYSFKGEIISTVAAYFDMDSSTGLGTFVLESGDTPLKRYEVRQLWRH